MKHTGVKATPKEVQHLRDMMNTPVLFLPGGQRMDVDPKKECHRLALAHGLPEIMGLYGITRDGEFTEI